MRSERGEFETVFAEAMLPRLVHQDRLADPRITDILWAMARRIGAKTFVEQTSAAMNRDDYRPVLQSVRCPTVVICGRQDAICPLADHRLMAAAVPGARLVTIEECGHLSPIERPHAVTAVMQYWLQL
jgi:pimeloyl-ACP methyl ester carboxylesterase